MHMFPLLAELLSKRKLKDIIVAAAKVAMESVYVYTCVRVCMCSSFDSCRRRRRSRAE